MRVHIDRKWLEWLDGDMITLVVITLIIVIALVYQKPPGRTGSE